ncbi:MAG: segregation and condensation protein A [Candidatus Porifericomitaceae bacterium WSBS_2022_MAG_OTU9]
MLEENKEVLAKVSGKTLQQLPESLYIPPEALRVFLQGFEGPLDLLLYLIRKHDIDILDIPMASIAKQYTSYIELMHELKLDLAGEYLVMSAMLADIKSRTLLPRPSDDGNGEEEDPRAELVRRIQIYERYRAAAIALDSMPRMERDILPVIVLFPDNENRIRPQPEVKLEELARAFADVLQRNEVLQQHIIRGEFLSVRERMSGILVFLQKNQEYVEYTNFFSATEGKAGVVVTVLAILGLLHESLIDATQNESYGMIHVRTN